MQQRRRSLKPIPVVGSVPAAAERLGHCQWMHRKGPGRMAGPLRGNEPVLIPMHANTSWRPPPSRPFLNLLCSLARLPLHCLVGALPGLSPAVVGTFFNIRNQSCQAVSHCHRPTLRSPHRMPLADPPRRTIAVDLDALSRQGAPWHRAIFDLDRGQIPRLRQLVQLRHADPRLPTPGDDPHPTGGALGQRGVRASSAALCRRHSAATTSLACMGLPARRGARPGFRVDLPRGCAVRRRRSCSTLRPRWWPEGLGHRAA
jgi:hypothetical protein